MDKILYTPQEVIRKLKERGVVLSLRMLNFYKAEGLLLYDKVSKDGGGFKCLYPDETIERITYIKDLQRREFTFPEIKQIVKDGGIDLFTERLKGTVDLWSKTIKKRESGELLKVKKYSSTYTERIKQTEDVLLKAHDILNQIWSGSQGTPA